MAKQTHQPNWQAAEARHRFAELIDAAAGGTPQFVRRRDGREVVVVSKTYFDRTKPTLKDVLLNFTFEHDDGSFDEALKDARSVVGAMFTPRTNAIEALLDDRSRHRPAKRTAAKR